MSNLKLGFENNYTARIKKLGVDLGNFGIKVSQDVGNNFTFESRCKTYDSSNYIFYNPVTLMYNDQNYLLGEGIFDHEIFKIKRSNLKECLAGAIAMADSIEDKDRLIIGVGLPILQYGQYKDKFRDILLGNNRTVKCSYGTYGQSLTKTVHIDDIEVFPEGIAAYWGIEDKLDDYWDMAGKLRRTNPPMLIIVDIGGRTTNICTVVRNLDGTTTPRNPDTIPYGTLMAYGLMCRKFNSFAIDKCISYTFTIEDIEPILYKGQVLDERFDTLDKDGYANLAYDKVAKHIIRSVKESNPDYDKALVVITGGGACRFGEKVQMYLPNNSVIDDNIYSNANGYLAALQSYNDPEK